MPATVKHVLTATTPDDPAYEIRPSHWNDSHALTLSLAGSEVSPVFSNANGASFGLSGTAVTLSYTVPIVSAFLTTAMLSNASSAFAGIGETVTTVAGTNFGLTVDTAGVQVAHPLWLTTAQPVGAYLTTARASNDAVGLNAAATQVTWTVNSSGISLDAGAYLTTAMASNAGSNFAGLGETIGTTAGTDLKMTVDSSGVNISHPKWITTAAAADHSHGNPTLALTNLTGTTASASNGFTLSLSAAAPGAGGGAALQGSGTYTQNTGTIQFANSNGVTFGLTNNQMTASVNSTSNVGLNTAATQVTWTVNSGGISLNAGAYLTTAMASNAGSNFAGLGETTGTTAGTDLKMTVDSSGVNISFPKWITTAAASDHSHGNPTLALTNLTGTTASASNGFTLSLSAAAPGAGGGAAISAGANSQNTGTVNFANSNGVTFGLSNNGTMTASVNSTSNVGLNTALTAGPLAWTVNSGGISLNAGSAAGTSSGFAGANISMSMTHNTAGLNISASVAAPGGGADKSASWHRVNELVTTAALWNNATFSNRPIFVPFKMGEAITAVNSVDIYVSRTGGTSVAASLHFGIYTIANATSMNLVSSTSFNVSLTTSAQFSGIRRLRFTGLGGLSLSPGQYVMGLLASQAGSASWGMNAMGIGSAAIAGVLHPGTNSTAATASGTHIEPFFGVWNANSAALPAAVGASSISGGNGVNSPRIYAAIKAIEA